MNIIRRPSFHNFFLLGCESIYSIYFLENVFKSAILLQDVKKWDIPKLQQQVENIRNLQKQFGGTLKKLSKEDLKKIDLLALNISKFQNLNDLEIWIKNQSWDFNSKELSEILNRVVISIAFRRTFKKRFKKKKLKSHKMLHHYLKDAASTFSKIAFEKVKKILNANSLNELYTIQSVSHKDIVNTFMFY